MRSLTSAELRDLRARAHHLDPVVAVGRNGLSEAVLHEIDVALRAHELIKVRVADDDRAVRASLAASICESLDCASVQRLGKLLVLWRPRPVQAEAAAPAARRPRKTPAPPSPRPGASRGSRKRAIGGRAPRDGDALPTDGDASRRRRRAGDSAPAAVPRAPSARRRRRLA